MKTATASAGWNVAGSVLCSLVLLSACATQQAPPAADAPAPAATQPAPAAAAPSPQPAVAAAAATPRVESPDGPPQAAENPDTQPLTAARAGAASRRAAPAAPQVDVALPSGLPASAANPKQMVAHFIDVGQGDAALLEFSCGAVLIDTGGETTDEVTGRDRLVEYLHEFFQRRSDLANTLQLVALSHPHVDHTDGVTGLLDENNEPAFIIENVIDNGTTDRGSGIDQQKALQKHARDNGLGYVGISEADIETTAGVTNSVIDPIDCRQGNSGVDPKISVLWGRVDLDTTWANNANNDTVVIRVDFGAASFLFTGDLEAEGIASMLDSYAADASAFNVDVLKIGHHGSHDTTTDDFVAATTPKIAIIQSGDSTLSRQQHSAFGYGHPNKKAIARLLAQPHGVSLTRPSAMQRVGLKGMNMQTGADPEFTRMKIDGAIYVNGWDGNIAVIANKDGTLSVETGF